MVSYIMNNRYISSDQGSPNQAKWVTFSSWFQWNHFIPLITRSFFLAQSAFWSPWNNILNIKPCIGQISGTCIEEKVWLLVEKYWLQKADWARKKLLVMRGIKW
jgi:hypothetical protein